MVEEYDNGYFYCRISDTDGGYHGCTSQCMDCYWHQERIEERDQLDYER